jgi:hypothetical protein
MMKSRTILLLLFCVNVSLFAASPVRINEFMASNGAGLADEDGQFSDWIELHNLSDDPVDLGGWFLTDDAADLTRWEFPSVPIAPRGYLVVFASNKNRNSPKLHANFSLAEGGEYLALIEPNGAIATAFAPEYPNQRRDVSYGFAPDNTLAFFNSSTPGAANTGAPINFVADTKFNPNRGFFEAPFDLAITTATPGAVIRYTTNGVPPTATTGLIYNGLIRISGTTTIRAAAFKAGLQPTDVDTQTYIFLDDVIRQSPTGTPPPGWPSSWGANTVDYGMDPAVVNDPRYRDTIKSDLKSIPTLSLVMRLADLFNPSTGIYANPGQDGVNWERPCSFELIYPDGRAGFQVNAGLRIRGGFSRSTDNPKHAFRLFFRDEYGDGKLNYPLFGESGAQEFDKVDLRTFQNYSWSFQGDGNGVFLRDQFSRDTQLAMGHNAERGDFYHLYINGHYWGLYNTCERPEAAYGATYYGGERDDYDTIKVDPYNTVATDGNMTAWTQLYNLARAGFASDAAYQRALGNHPDGTPNPEYPVLVDLDNLIDYMLMIIYSGNKDAPISNFLGNTNPNNFYSLRNRRLEARMGFHSFLHDSEHTLLVPDIDIDRTGPFPSGDTSVSKSNPQWIWQKLQANVEFKMRVADRIQKYFFNGGLLTPAANRERFLARKAEIDRAVVAESARWGDAKRATPFTRDTHWVAAINNILNNYFPQRTQIALNQLKAKGLYPNLAAPSFAQQGGNVAAGFPLAITAPAGAIYFTLDGEDPRLPGGAISSKAARYSSSVALNDHALVKARAYSNGVWSALNEAQFTIIRAFSELMVSELMYNPPAFGMVDGDELEFVELKNVGSQELLVGGVRFVNGLDYVFPAGTRIAPGGFHLLARNPEQFAAKYPGVRIDGLYTNRLANSGETIGFAHATGAILSRFTFDDQPPWPVSPDGTGFSLVPRVLDSTLDYNNPANWRASANSGGSPGRDDPALDVPAVIVNEVLTHTDLPAMDAVELHNASVTPADISGWYLTDDAATPQKFRIPANTVIPPGGFLVFDESHFNAQPGVSPSFSFNSHGEEVHLSAANADGSLAGYTDGFRFQAAQNGVSFGRYTNTAGEILYPAQLTVTLGAANSGPRVGPVVINEIRYQSGPVLDEFIELKNVTGEAVPLFDPVNPANTWKLGGVSFQFPEGTQIAPFGRLVISDTEPELFRQRNNLPAQVPVLGPFSGNLQDNGELLELSRPDNPDGAVVPYIVVDAVRYGAQPPWPSDLAGTNSSLERIVAAKFGNDPANWRRSPGAPSPGIDNDGNRLPLVDAGIGVEIVAAAFPVSTNLTATATDDGKPNGVLTYQWSQVGGPGVVQIQNANQLAANFAFPGVGAYVLQFSASDGEFTVSDTVAISIARPLAETLFVPRGSVWKYLDDGSDQQTAWRAPAFNDASWKSGRAELGYGDTQDTVIASGPDSARFITSYFRHSFQVLGARGVVSLAANRLRDDGAGVYLNGVEVWRSKLPQPAITYLTTASSVVGGGDESAYFDHTLDPALLREGLNVLAVEVHQQNPGSSDLGFDLEISGLVSSSNDAPTADAGAAITSSTLGPVELLGTGTDDGLPNPPGVFTATWNILDGPGSVSFANANSPRTSATFSQGGVYQLRLSISDGELTATDDLQVTVTAADPYAEWKQTHFSIAELGDPAISGDEVDPDGDSFPNRWEFIAGTDPRDPASFLHVAEVARENDDFVIRFEALGDKSYTIQGRLDAAAGSWERVVDLSPQGTTAVIDVLDRMKPASRRVYRVVTPLQPPE